MVFLPAQPPPDPVEPEPAEHPVPAPRPGEATYRAGTAATYRGETQEPTRR